MGKRISNIHESTRRFNAASPKNTKEHYHYTTLTNRNPAERFRQHRSMIKGPSKEHEHTEVEFCGIVIPNGNGKKFPKYYLQPT